MASPRASIDGRPSRPLWLLATADPAPGRAEGPRGRKEIQIKRKEIKIRGRKSKEKRKEIKAQRKGIQISSANIPPCFQRLSRKFPCAGAEFSPVPRPSERPCDVKQP